MLAVPLSTIVAGKLDMEDVKSTADCRCLLIKGKSRKIRGIATLGEEPRFADQIPKSGRGKRSMKHFFIVPMVYHGQRFISCYRQ
jgi:hypothetical protein